MTEPSSVHRSPLGRATIGDQLRRHALNQPTKTAVVSFTPDGERLACSYAELDRRANRIAHAFLAHGVTRGDRVAVMSRNRVETIVAYYAALKIGASYTGINPMFRPDEVLQQLVHAEPAVLVVSEELLPVVDHVVGEAPPALAVVLGEEPGEQWVTWASLERGRPETEPDTDVDENDLALIVYTSGTESAPKGVMIPHRNYMISTTPSWTWGLKVTPADVWLFAMPFHSIAGIGCLTSLTLIGATVVLPNTLEPGTTLATIRDEDVNVVAQTPTLFLSLCRHPGFGPGTVGRVQRCLTYGGTLSQFATDAWAKAAPDMVWGTYWGQGELTQLGSVGFFKTLDEVPDHDPTWIGKAVPHLETRVVGPDGKDAEIGELWCRSPSAMVGYYKDPEKTAAVMHDGWIHTGDIVRIDAERNLFFYDRSKDVIKTGGLNVSSQEVERVLQRHPAVLRAAVVGLPDDYWSEVVTAFVILDDGATVRETDLIAHCKASMASYKAPKTVRIVEAFPTDAQGKVLKRELRKIRSTEEVR
ncbi:class I adenylate-forming enzyme family protein [Streptomyces spongiae]|uniref:Acyl--CoA ligase n=1 Tax=Streptomyces spongiae TaxID=565072 RepID=A0A5N8XHV9_9ACTN|nr:class I adenylate-forming enzyme family protein [Streptomyces spongiae]MPY59052.1 acyl--CoA ligase [Streptomyces spongiae]